MHVIARLIRGLRLRLEDESGFALGIVVAGVGVQRIVTAASHTTLTVTDTSMLIGAVIPVMLSLTIVGALSAGRQARGPSRLIPNLCIVAVAMVVGLAVRIESPVVMIVVTAGLCAAQLACSLPRPSAGSPTRAHTAVQYMTDRARRHAE